MLLANAVESGDEFGRQNGRDRLAQDLGARLLVHALHLGVPALDTIVEVDREDADVNRFDDILVKLLEAFKLGNLLLQPPVELCVLNGDTDVACQRFQQFHVLAREEVTVVSAAQANDCDGASASTFTVCDAAGKIVVQIKSAGAAARRLVRPWEAARSKCRPLPALPSPSDARKTATRVTSNVCGRRSTMESS